MVEPLRGTGVAVGYPGKPEVGMASLQEQIASDPARAVWLILGKEPLLVERAVSSIVEAVTPMCGPPAFNVFSGRLSDGDADEALTTARTVPMMSERRLVVVAELEKGKNAFFESLLGYLEDPSPTTTLILHGTGYPPVVKGGRSWSKKVATAVGKVGVSHKFGDRDVDPQRFAVAHATELGHKLGRREAKLLVDLVGSDLGRVAREVEKAALYVPSGDPITADAVVEACSMLAEAEVWDLTAGIVGRDPNQALACLHRLLEAGESPHRLLALVMWQMRTVLRVAELLRRRVPDAEIRTQTRVRVEVLGRIRRLLDRGFPGAGVVLSRIARANRSMNSVRAGDRRVLETLVVELAVGAW